jgi:aldose 1-epimerase
MHPRELEGLPVTGQTTTTPTTQHHGGAGRIAPSGRQFDLRHGQQHAVVVEVGGGLRDYRLGEQALLDGYPRDQRCTGARGLPLIPWPNRIQDGAYTFDGIDYQVPLTEPEAHNAIHGFLRWRNWACRRSSPGQVVMGTVLHPQMGYPFTLDVSVDYRLDDDGLSVRTTATNIGDQPCPYGTGQHPYLSAGTDLIDPCRLELDAGQWLPTDERGLPTGHAPTAGSDYDFRHGRQIGEQDIDYTFTDLARSEAGLAWVQLTAADGTGVALWADRTYPFLEIYTAHTQPAPHRRRGLGVEPMTCAPNAFRTGEGLIRLAPGESNTANWGLHPI